MSSAGVANGTLTITPPASTPSGTDVTLTLEAKAPGGKDSNYAVLRLAVVRKVGGTSCLVSRLYFFLSRPGS